MQQIKEKPANRIVVSGKSALFGTYKRIFANPIRRDRYFLKGDKWVSVDSPLEDRFFHDHLAGNIILGYGFRESASGIVCFDIDNHGRDQYTTDTELHALTETIERYTGKLPIIEQSIRNGGYHVFIPLMNGLYAEYGEKIRRFSKHILSLSGVDCEVFGAGAKTGNLRAPFSRDYNLINPYSGEPTGATGYEAIELLTAFIREGIYIQNHRIDLDVIPSQVHQSAPKEHREINDKAAHQVYSIMEKGLQGPGQRIKTLRAIFWYLVTYHGNTTDRAIRELEYWIQTKHNGQSRDINADPSAGIQESIEFIHSLAGKHTKYKGSAFYFQNSTGIELSPSARLLASHLLDLVHYCAVSDKYPSATGFKRNGQYHVSIPYTNTVRDQMDGFKDPYTGKSKRHKAELELERLGLLFKDRQTKVFLPQTKPSPPTFFAVNVQALYGFRTGRDAWIKYQDKMNNDRAFRWLLQASEKYKQKEIADIIGARQQYISRWKKSGKVPKKYHHMLYVLRQV